MSRDSTTASSNVEDFSADDFSNCHTFAKARVVDAKSEIVALDGKDGRRSFAFAKSREESEIRGFGEYRCLGKNEQDEQCKLFRCLRGTCVIGTEIFRRARWGRAR